MQTSQTTIDRITMKDILNQLRPLIPALKQENFDKFIVILKGGLTFAHILGNTLDIRDMLFIDVCTYDGLKKTKDKYIKFLFDKHILSNDYKYLIVEDIIDTNETMEMILGEFESLGLNNFKIITVCNKTAISKVRYDYNLFENNNWIVCDWAVFEPANIELGDRDIVIFVV